MSVGKPILKLSGTAQSLQNLGHETYIVVLQYQFLTTNSAEGCYHKIASIASMSQGHQALWALICTLQTITRRGTYLESKARLAKFYGVNE